MYCTDFVVYPSGVVQFYRISNFGEKSGRVTVRDRTLVTSSTTRNKRRGITFSDHKITKKKKKVKDIVYNLQISVIQRIDFVINFSEVLQFCRLQFWSCHVIHLTKEGWITFS